MLRLELEDWEIEGAKELERPLSLLILPLAQAGWPGIVIGTPSGIEITKKNYVFLTRDITGGCLQIHVELTFFLVRGVERFYEGGHADDSEWAVKSIWSRSETQQTLRSSFIRFLIFSMIFLTSNPTPCSLGASCPLPF